LPQGAGALDGNRSRAEVVFVRNSEAMAAWAMNEPKMTFIGRCGTYQYLDMDQVIHSHSLMSGNRWRASIERPKRRP